MPEWCALGHYASGYGAIIDLKKGIAIFRVNTALISCSTDLELIPEGPSGYAPGMIIDYLHWTELYCVIERDGWGEDEYFLYAKRRLKELNVKKP